MPRAYVFLYENGTQISFANLSGEDEDSIDIALSHYGKLNTDPEPGTEVKYAVIEGEGIPLNKRIEIHPSGFDKKRHVEVEFRNTTGGRRKKTRGKSKKSRKTRRHRKVRYI